MRSPKLKKSPKKSLVTLAQEFHHRLAELEMELSKYPSRPAAERALQMATSPEAAVIGEEHVVRFKLHGKSYAAGHTDTTYAGSNHARGVRQIRFYADDILVLHIEGDYENQQFGSNFRFQNVRLHTPGEWEADFVKLTDDLHDFKAKRRHAFNKKRITESRRHHSS